MVIDLNVMLNLWQYYNKIFQKAKKTNKKPIKKFLTEFLYRLLNSKIRIYGVMVIHLVTVMKQPVARSVSVTVTYPGLMIPQGKSHVTVTQFLFGRQIIASPLLTLHE